MLFQSAHLASTTVLAARHAVIGYEFSWSMQPVLALIAGLLILLRPKLLNYIVAIYLILVGVTGILRISF